LCPLVDFLEKVILRTNGRGQVGSILSWNVVNPIGGVPPEAISPKVFPNLRRTHESGNLQAQKTTLFLWEHENI